MLSTADIALHIKTKALESTYKRICKSESLVINFNPETVEKKYICDRQATEELVSYKISIAQGLTVFKGEEDYALIWDYVYNLKVGEEARATGLVTFFLEPTPDDDGSQKKFKAWEGECIIKVNDINADEGKINFDISFGGTMKKGENDMTSGQPQFTEKSFEA